MNTTQHRLVTCLQQRGNIGKSTVFTALAEYCEHRGVGWQGFDLDADNRSFSRIFPDKVTLRTLAEEPAGEVIKLAKLSAEAPVTLIDPRAHLGEEILAGWDVIHFPEYFSSLHGRITVLLFPGDDLEILTDIDRIVGHLGNAVDYLIVHNPARQPRHRMFDGSALEADLLKFGALQMQVPVLLATVRNHLAALEAELDRGVSHVEAAKNFELPLDGLVRLVVEDWTKTLFRRFDTIAGHLLPTSFAAQIDRSGTPQAPRDAHSRRGDKINRQNL